jgi:hypothetical protein
MRSEMRALGRWAVAGLMAEGLFACSDDPSLADQMAERGLGRQTIEFRALIGAEPWSCSGAYVLGSPPSEARPSHLRLFVSDLALSTSEGQSVPLVLDENVWQGNFDDVGHSVALLDFDDATGNCRFTDAETHTTITGWAPNSLDYTGLSFKIGVPNPLNHLDAGLAPAPMNRPGMWWSWRDGQVQSSG